MKKIILSIAAATLLFAGCQKQQCKNTITFISMNGNVMATLKIDGKVKTLTDGEKIKVNTGSLVELDGENYLIDDCGRMFTIYTKILPDGGYKMYMQ